MKDLIFALLPALSVIIIIVLFTIGLWTIDAKVERALIRSITVLALIVAVISIWRAVDVLYAMFGSNLP